MKIKCTLIIFVLITGAVNATDVKFEIGKPQRIVSLFNSDMNNQYFAQPKGPYAVMVFCEPSFGDYIGVVRNDHLQGPGGSPWELSNRFWQEDKWASDVTSFAWSLDGQYLLVAMGGIYGNCGLYLLDLNKRQSKRLFPKIKEGDACEVADVNILSVNGDTVKFQYDTETGNAKTDENGKIVSLGFITSKK